MIIVFTSANNAYIPKASILVESLKNIYPEFYFICVLSDKKDNSIDYAVFDEVLTVEDLEIPAANLETWIFSHTTVELCTAVKPFAFKKIFRDKNPECILYIDPDIVLYSPLVELFEALEKFPVVVTPHVTVPAVNEIDMLDGEMLGCLRHGVFNLGFLALKNSGEGITFLNWWADRCLGYCYDDGPRGLFTDQRWIDLAPCFFEDMKILRLPNYNVATWNLYYRHIEKDENGILVVNQKYPLRFFHFSGFDLGTHELMLKRHAPDNQTVLEMTNWYIERQKFYRQDEIGKKTGFYDAFPDGEVISRDMRIYFRNNNLDTKFSGPYSNHAYRDWWRINIVNSEKHPVIRKFKAKIAGKFPRVVGLIIALKTKIIH
jgi:hypothetical protein